MAGFASESEEGDPAFASGLDLFDHGLLWSCFVRDLIFLDGRDVFCEGGGDLRLAVCFPGDLYRGLDCALEGNAQGVTAGLTMFLVFALYLSGVISVG